MKSLVDEQLGRLHSELSVMGGLCEEAIRLAAAAFRQNDPASAQQTCDLSIRIERCERDVESLCLRILLLRHPVASDLRRVSCALKVITDLQRIGHQSADIAEILLTDNVFPLGLTDGLDAMSEAVIAMVSRGVDAFIRSDVALARAVIAEDDAVDALFAQARASIVCRLTDAGEHGAALVNNLMIAKYFERIGDHAVLLARRTVFAVTGEWENSDKPGGNEQ